MITAEDAARILAAIALYDHRTIGQLEAQAWAAALNHASPPIGLEDALSAVVAWHAENAEGRMRPAHVIRGAQRVARARAGARRALELAAARSSASVPLKRTEEDARLIAELRARLGTGDRTRLRRPEWVRAERQRDRDRDAEPNPLFRRLPPPEGWPAPGGERA